MIYFTTFVLTLLLWRIIRAAPACGDVASPEELYDPTYADAQAVQHPLPMTVYNVTALGMYDNPNGDTNKTACPSLARSNPHFGNFRDFPYIGGAFNIKSGSPKFCGSCWRLTYVKTNESIYITAMDTATTGFSISRGAFRTLNGGPFEGKLLEAEAKEVHYHRCFGK